MALSPKRQRFVEEFLVDQHVTNAAKRAGYSPASAYSQGSDLLKNPEIKAAVEKGLAKLSAKAEKRAEKAGITKEWWLNELHKTASADIDDYVEVVSRNWRNGKRGKQYVVQDIVAVPTKDRPKGSGSAIKKISATKNGISIELHSKNQALDTIGKHYGWVRENVHHSGGTVDKIQVVDEAALKEALKKLDEEI